MLQVNVARLHEDNREALSLAWVAGREGGTAVRREAVAAAALIGHLNLTHPNSIQVIGAYEAAIVAGFTERLFESHPAAVIVADGVAPPPALVEAATRTHTPLFTSPLPAPRVIEGLARYLAKLLAETIERHGVFMDVLGQRRQRGAARVDADRRAVVSRIGQEVDRLHEEVGRQVVDAVVARVLEHAQRDALARAGEPAD